MSAYTDGRPVSVFAFGKEPLPPKRVQDVEPPESNAVADKLESLIGYIRQMETALTQERGRARKLRDEWAEAHSLYQQATKDAEARMRELTFNEGRLKAQLQQHEESDTEIKKQIAQIQGELSRTRDELRQYQNAWSSVLQREREAKMIILDAENTRKVLADTEKNAALVAEQLQAEKTLREQLERHSKSYQLELQAALVRIHSSEAKFNEISKEMQAVQKSKKAIDEECARIEKSMKERYRWEAQREIEQGKAEIEKNAAIDREKFREELRGKVQSQVDEAIAHERSRLIKIREQYELDRAGMRKAFEATTHELSEKLLESQKTVADLRTQSQAERESAEQRTREAEAIVRRNEHVLRKELSRLESELESERTKQSRESLQSQQMIERLTLQLESERANFKKTIESERGASQKTLDSERSAFQKALTAEKSAVKASNERLYALRSRIRSFVASTREMLKVARKDRRLERREAERAKNRGASLERFILVEKSRFDGLLIEAQLEFEAIRAHHPIRELLVLKQSEIERLEDPVDIDEKMREYSELRARATQIEAELSDRIERIKRAREISTVQAGPAV